MNQIRYLGFSNFDPSVNMSVDEMLFKRALENNKTASLRFFTFNRRCISIGKNQRTDKLPEEFLNAGLEIVKRPTGGGAVMHDRDLCYALVLPESYLGPNSALMNSYRMITGGLKHGFKLCGVDVQYGSSDQHQNEPVCFNKAWIYELSLQGKKLVGSAQKRAKGILLQQGSIMKDHHVPVDRLINALLEGLRLSLNIEYTDEPLTKDELEVSKVFSRNFAVTAETTR